MDTNKRATLGSACRSAHSSNTAAGGYPSDGHGSGGGVAKEGSCDGSGGMRGELLL